MRHLKSTSPSSASFGGEAPHTVGRRQPPIAAERASGGRFSRRFPRLVSVLGELPTRSAIIVALNGKDLGKLPLERRQARRQALLSRFACPTVLASESFGDGQALLRVAEKHGLEGIVSKRRGAP